jgi:RNA polymerase sigma-70 factor (ECF subfamily)
MQTTVTGHDLDRTRAYVRSVAMKYVRDEQDAEDVTQDAMLLAHRYRDSFRGESRYSTWLYRVTATAALMFLRKQRRLSREIPASGSVDEEGTGLLERQAAPSDLRGEVIARAEAGTVAEAVARLGAKYPAVFWKRYGEGRTETEIAKELGLSVAAVKTPPSSARICRHASAVSRDSHSTIFKAPAASRSGRSLVIACAPFAVNAAPASVHVVPRLAFPRGRQCRCGSGLPPSTQRYSHNAETP